MKVTKNAVKSVKKMVKASTRALKSGASLTVIGAAMKERGQYQIQFLKTRSSSGVGSKVDLGFDPNTLRIFDLDSDSQVVGHNSTADMVADLRRKNSKVAATKTDEVPAPASKSIKDLDALRALVRR